MASSLGRYAPRIRIGLAANLLPRWNSKLMEAVSAHCRSSRVNSKGPWTLNAFSTCVYCSKSWRCSRSPGVGFSRAARSFSRGSQPAPPGAHAAALLTRAEPETKTSIKSGASFTKAWTVWGNNVHRRRACSRVIAPADHLASTSPLSMPITSRKGR